MKSAQSITIGYYVTVRDAGRTGFLAGPYGLRSHALAKVEDVKALAIDADPWAHFYSFGTSRVNSEINLRRGGVTFGKV